MSLEWMASYVEERPTFFAMSLPALPSLALECCRDLMFEVEATLKDAADGIAERCGRWHR